MDEASEQQLIQLAINVRENAYAPYSEYAVGAAVKLPNGETFVGVNVENASYGLTICAERSAVVAAVAAGLRDIDALAIVGPGAPAPCGACRQFLYEFNPDMRLLLVDSQHPTEVTRHILRDLLPHGFRLSP